MLLILDKSITKYISATIKQKEQNFYLDLIEEESTKTIAIYRYIETTYN